LDFSIKLNKGFVAALNELRSKYGEEIASLNGLSDLQMSYNSFIDNFVDKNTVADASIDGNANVGTKDVCSLTTEMSKPHLKLLSFNKIYYELTKKYGHETAMEWLEGEWVGRYYLHDASSATFIPYCYAYDLEALVNKGLFFIDNFNAQPPKHLTTYTDFVGEFVSWTSNRSSGACGLPSFLVYSFYFWKKDCETNFLINNPEYYRDQEFQRIIYKLNQPYLRVNQSAFTNFSIFDKPYYEAIFGGKEFPDGTPMVMYTDEFIEYQKAFMRVVSDIRSKNMMTFPVLSYCLLRKNGSFVDEDFAKWCCRHNMKWADSNFFISEDVTSLSNCCRLVSDIKNLGYFNSLGGTALEVGSVKVNTINLARIAYESKNTDNYIENLTKEVNLCCKTLDTVRHIIQRNAEKGLLPNYTHGIVNMKSQYNTIGILGIYEVLVHYGMTKTDKFGYVYYTDEGIEFAKQILKTITDVKNEFQSNVDYSINIEQVPAERAAAVLMEKDKVFFPNEKYELPLYGNQWIPLGIKTTISEKVKLSAIMDKACSGGSIAHINLDGPMEDFDTAWDLLNRIADAGVVYFAFCTKISACEHNHGFYGDVCPICGGEKVTTYQRIVGFLTPEKTYSKERKAEFRMRDWFSIDRMSEL
jgi:ribonucleoside-triphosphate reductase